MINRAELERKMGIIDFEIIFGQAGSGKSTELINMIKNEEMNPIILCSKWMLVRSTRDRLRNEGIDCRVTTLQSITSSVGNEEDILNNVDTIILDEFSQIDYIQLLVLSDAANKMGINRIIAAGDFLQNEPIEGGSYSPIRHIIRQFILGKESNFFSSLIKGNIYEKMYFSGNREIEVPKALNSIFKSIKYKVLIENHRQNDGITIRGYKDIQHLIAINNYDVLQPSKMMLKLKMALEMHDWQIIVADWQQMSVINKYALRFEDIYISSENQFYIDVRGYEDKSHRKYYRKIDDKYMIVNGRNEGQPNANYIFPTYAIIADSAQGLEFENVLLFSMLDESVESKTKFNSWSNFSFNSLYMAATRHRGRVDICADKQGMLDISRTIEKLPPARKDLVGEEWLMYCVMNAPNPKDGYEEYCKKSHFIKDEDTGKIYAYTLEDIKNGNNRTEIQFAKGAKKDIELYSETRFMRLWVEMKDSYHDYCQEIIRDKYDTKNNLSKSKGGNRKNPSKAEKFISDIGEDNIDLSLSVRNFKKKYNINKKHVITALEK